MHTSNLMNVAETTHAGEALPQSFLYIWGGTKVRKVKKVHNDTHVLFQVTGGPYEGKYFVIPLAQLEVLVRD